MPAVHKQETSLNHESSLFAFSVVVTFMPLCVIVDIDLASYPHIIAYVVNMQVLNKERLKTDKLNSYSVDLQVVKSNYIHIYIVPKKSTMLVLITLGFIISSLFWYFMTRLPPNYPPTPPTRLPILGHMHYLFWIRDSKHRSALHKMFKRYSKNDMLTLHIGVERVTMIGKKIYDICLCFH